MDDRSCQSKAENSKMLFYLITSPLSWIGLWIILRIALIPIAFVIVKLGLSVPTDPSGRLALFGQPLMVYFFIGFPVYFVAIGILAKFGKLPASR